MGVDGGCVIYGFGWWECVYLDCGFFFEDGNGYFWGSVCGVELCSIVRCGNFLVVWIGWNVGGVGVGGDYIRVFDFGYLVCWFFGCILGWGWWI